MDTTTLYEKEVSFQADRRRAGVKLIKIISDLWYDKSIEMVLFRNQLIDRNVSDIINLHGWSQGSFSGMSWSNIRVAAVVVGLAVLFTFFLSKPISAYQLGEAYAQSMGVNIKTFRVILILLSSILSACVTAFAGPISFVGIAVPFLARKAFGTSKPIVVIPGTFFMGAVFCMICDLIARMALAPVEMNISTVTSILGAPIVIYMMIPKGGRK